MVRSARSRFGARLVVGVVAAAVALGIGAARAAGAAGGHAAGPSAGVTGVHTAFLLADRRGGGGHHGDGAAGRHPGRGGRDTNHHAPADRGAVHAAKMGTASPPGPKGPGERGAGGVDHPAPQAERQGHPKVPSRQAPTPPPAVSQSTLVPRPTPPPAVAAPSPSPAPPAPAGPVRLAAGPSVSGGGASGGGHPATARGASGSHPPGSSASGSRPGGSKGTSSAPLPVLAGLPPLGLLPMVSGLQLGAPPQIAIFLILANALLGTAILTASRRGRRLTRRSLEGGRGKPGYGGGEHLDDWPSAP